MVFIAGVAVQRQPGRALEYPKADQLQGLAGNVKLKRQGGQERKFLLFLSEFSPGFDSGKRRSRGCSSPHLCTKSPGALV